MVALALRIVRRSPSDETEVANIHKPAILTLPALIGLEVVRRFSSLPSNIATSSAD